MIHSCQTGFSTLESWACGRDSDWSLDGALAALGVNAPCLVPDLPAVANNDH